MKCLRDSFMYVGWNLSSLKRNIRLYFCLTLGGMICWLLTSETLRLSLVFNTNVHILEPFIWCFSDSDGILYVSLILLLLTASFPNLGAATSYLLFRSNRSTWIVGQILTVFLLTFIYCVFLVVISMLCCNGNIIFENRWSETAFVLSFSPALSHSELEISRKMIKSINPYDCVLQIFCLMIQYMLFLSLIQIVATLRKNKRIGISIVFSLELVDYILVPNRLQTWLRLPSGVDYYAKIIAAWCSPLQHVTYIMHNYGYDYLPKLWVSHIIMGSISLVMVMYSYFLTKKYDYCFLGGANNDF